MACVALAIGGALAPPAAGHMRVADGGAAQADRQSDPAAAPSPAAAGMIAWVIASGDNGGRPFIVLDKAAAALFVFDAAGAPVGAAPALLGVAIEDVATPGIGDRPMSQIGPAERTTPAGRFVARYGPAAGGRTVLWVDHDSATALHPVVTGNARERRLQRLESLSPDDNRITFGCINVPVPFYRDVVQPLFSGAGGIVYVLPETRPIEEVFPRMAVSAAAPSDLPPGKIAEIRSTSFSIGR